MQVSYSACKVLFQRRRPFSHRSDLELHLLLSPSSDDVKEKFERGARAWGESRDIKSGENAADAAAAPTQARELALARWWRGAAVRHARVGEIQKRRRG